MHKLDIASAATLGTWAGIIQFLHDIGPFFEKVGTGVCTGFGIWLLQRVSLWTWLKLMNSSAGRRVNRLFAKWFFKQGV